MMTRVNRSDPASANEIVNPIGRNMTPSTPERVKIGVKTKTIIRMAIKSGLATSLPARIRAPIFPPSPGSCRCRYEFSTYMMAASAIRPIAIASPPSDIRSAAMLACFMMMNVSRIEKGRVKTVISAEGKSPMKRKSTMMTSRIPSARLVATVE